MCITGSLIYNDENAACDHGFSSNIYLCSLRCFGHDHSASTPGNKFLEYHAIISKNLPLGWVFLIKTSGPILILYLYCRFFVVFVFILIISDVTCRSTATKIALFMPALSWDETDRPAVQYFNQSLELTIWHSDRWIIVAALRLVKIIHVLTRASDRRR